MFICMSVNNVIIDWNIFICVALLFKFQCEWFECSGFRVIWFAVDTQSAVNQSLKKQDTC